MFAKQRCTIQLISAKLKAQNRNIYGGQILFSANHYEALGITKHSTQGEIKAAYYRLSMLYHPDKNQGSETAAIKFREITQAYEVLGNFRLRRLYDKGMIHRTGLECEQKSEKHEEVSDDPSTKFYKSRFTKSKVSDSKGRTPIYNFDEWSREHYGKSFDRRQKAKAKYDRSTAYEKEHSFAIQNEILLFSIGFFCVVTYWKYMSEASHDTPKEKSIKPSEDERNKNDS